jgi:hypothetical protein
VRIDDGDAAACFDILENEIPKQRRFAGAGLSDGVDVLTPSAHVDFERGLSAPSLPFSCDNVNWFLFHPSKPLLREESPPRGLDYANDDIRLLRVAMVVEACLEKTHRATIIA